MHPAQPIADRGDGSWFVDETFTGLKRRLIREIGTPIVLIVVGTGLLLFSPASISIARIVLVVGACLALYPTGLGSGDNGITPLAAPMAPELKAKLERLTAPDVGSLGPFGSEVAEFLTNASALNPGAVERLRFSRGWRRIAILSNIARYRVLDDRHELLRLIRPTPRTNARSWILAEGLRWKYPIDVRQTLEYAAMAILYQDVIPSNLTKALLAPTSRAIGQR